MKHRQILFSDPMVQAILANRKTQTRRVIEPQPKVGENETVYEVAKGDWWVGQLHNFPLTTHFSGNSSTRFGCPYGKPGDILWVKETFTILSHSPNKSLTIRYEDGTERTCFLTANEWAKFSKWKRKKGRISSLFMFRSLSRISLLVTAVRLERLHDISEEDAIAEGVDIFKTDMGYKMPTPATNIHTRVGDPITAFKCLWISINGLASWDANPRVFVITFRPL